MNESCSHIDRKQSMLFFFLQLLATEGALGCNQEALPVKPEVVGNLATAVIHGGKSLVWGEKIVGAATIVADCRV